ncbi:MAG TPA: ABC transporter permease [Acidimicrobiia bacterium]
MPSNLAGAETEAVGQRRGVWQGMAAPGLGWLVLLFLVPFYAILATGMGGRDPIFNQVQPAWNPLDWNPQAFIDVAKELFGGYLGPTAVRTIAYVFIACLLCILIGYPMAYLVSRKAGRWKGLLLLIIIAPFWINYLMRMMAWVNLLSPDGQINKIIGFFGVPPVDWLAGNHFVVIMGLVYGYIPFFILPLFAALDRIDNQVLEAARDMGASPAQTFWRVTVPLSKQGILAGLVIIALPMFGDYYTPNLLSGSPRTRMIGNDIDQLLNATASGTGQGAALTIYLMLFVGVLMIYYLVNVSRAAKEARR